MSHWKVSVLCVILLVCSSTAKHIVQMLDLSHEKDSYHPSRHHDLKSNNIAEEELHSEFWNDLAQETLLNKLNNEPITNKAKNIIFFIGDGMSSQTVAATRMYMTGNENGYLSFEKFPHTGQAITYCVNRQVADSACTGSAYLSGVKVNYGMLNVAASVPRSTCEHEESANINGIMKWAQDAGKATGIVTNTRITHASPAASYAHSSDRNFEFNVEVTARGCDQDKTIDIARQLIQNEVSNNFKVAMGGGRRNFISAPMVDEEGITGARTDGRNLIQEWLQNHQEMGESAYVWNRKELMSLDTNNTEYLLGLFEADHMMYNLEVQAQNAQDMKPTLADMTEAAIKILQKSDEGFVLFIEGGMIDQAHHSTRPRRALDETAEYSKAIELARAMTSEEDTLIVVSADHSHTMTYNGYPKRGSDVLGIADIADGDDLPYTTLSYANGPGYSYTYDSTRARRLDISGWDFSSQTQRYLATAPLGSETHGGDDIGVWASGPQAHLFTGVYEQNTLPVLMAHAGGFEEFIDTPDSTEPTDPTETTDPTDSTDPTETTDWTDPTEETTDPTDSTDPTETTDWTDPTEETTDPTEETTESTDSTDSTGTTDWTDPTDSTGTTDWTDPTDSTDSTGTTVWTDPTEETTDPTDSTDSTETTDWTDPTEEITDSSNSTDTSELTDPDTDPIETTVEDTTEESTTTENDDRAGNFWSQLWTLF